MTEAAVNDPAQSAKTGFAVGATVPPFVRDAGFQAWNRYAAVNSEFVDIHMDDAAGQAAGYPGAFGMGNLLWSWLHRALERWLDGHGSLEHLELRFHSPALKGDRITCTGIVTGRTEKEDGTTVLELDVWAENQSGERIAPGRARIRLGQAAR
ncbi:MaoC/PaaZ C-terminal domain-containing protein [Streptomyces sp. NPDC097610]|uniref:MaoC/PaaZ C-terminal domain-containing protein n=1 Tax=Streptomyces sp. NPDC097610 TaxID=3157227 RepID=UPI00331B141C